MPFGIDEVPRQAAAGALPAPVGAGGPGGIDGEVGPEEVERLACLVVGGDIQLPDVEGLPWLAWSFSYSSGEYFSSRTLQVAAFWEAMRAVPCSWMPSQSRGPRPKPESPEAPASRKGGVPGRCMVSWGDPPGGSLAQSGFPSGWVDPRIELVGHGLRASRGQGLVSRDGAVGGRRDRVT